MIREFLLITKTLCNIKKMKKLEYFDDSVLIHSKLYFLM
jgi:hypothetical protein